MKDLNGRTLLEQLDELSTAEDFFLFFLIPFEQPVLNIARLHIMKRMGQYIMNSDFSNKSEDEIFLEGRLHLKKAYMDFVESTPLEEKVFKVFKDKAQEEANKFVPLGELTIAAE